MKESRTLDINEILRQVDRYFEENKGEEAETLMCRSLEQAAEEGDEAVQLQLLNELLGYYREVSRKEELERTAERAIALAKRMGLEDTIPYATTLLNVATGYRSCGKLQESMGYYLQVQELYDRLLKPDDMFMAGLKNNMSLLYQEMGDFRAAKERQLEALAIAEKNHAVYELGVTCANLAGSCMGLEEREEAYEYALRSVKLFQAGNVEDSHYAAALATLGAYFYAGEEYEKALQYYGQAMDIVERNLGRNAYYHRLKEYVEACEKDMAASVRKNAGGTQAKGEGRGGKAAEMRHAGEETAEKGSAGEKSEGTGLRLARDYYETFGRPMIEKEFPAYMDKIAVGLAGRGSDCFGYDDEASRDHDWGPDFCMWVTDETWQEIGEALQQAYEKLPEEFQGYRKAPNKNGRNRRGVIRISDFYRGLVGTDVYSQIDWRSVQDSSLAAAVNGEIFRDEEGIFSAFREALRQGYPDEIRYLKLAESAARYAQTAQYNYPRMHRRGDLLTARMMVWDGIKEAMKLQYYIEGKYPPHDKWLFRGLQESAEGRAAAALLEKIAGGGNSPEGDDRENPDAVLRQIEQAGEFFAMEMYRRDLISDTDSYLDAHSEELVYKASLAAKSEKELVKDIARLEFEAFDKVKNEGGRASCQDDWPTFYVMRSSQYLTWNRTMLMQYLYDFYREYHRGHNLIEEKYGRMMESTAPEEYEKIKAHFPELSPEKKQIIEQIVGMQVGWMEEFAESYSALAHNARNIHTTEDNPLDTSYETYLRGELGTYSDKMLELYGRYVVDYARTGRNLTFAIMENSVKMYGYGSVEEANNASGKKESSSGIF
ncbi:DUF4125 family protein [Acetatifactor muris]|uniref:DUF4125 family protein n=1 Tax=Acetatifactor muris TaxID=879566 RepID=UPI0023F2C5BF|nr:DUF4125 family protein [Acetatifactor muris]